MMKETKTCFRFFSIMDYEKEADFLRKMHKKGWKFMDRVRKLTGAEPLLIKGFTGKGITAAILDSGIYPHPDLKERIIDFRDFLNGQTGCYDDYGHGTHVAGILAGNGKLSRGRYRGIAPDCRLLPVKVLNRRGNGSRQDILRGIEFVIATREQYHTRILNISVGTLEE